jgi:hypothetical protein
MRRIQIFANIDASHFNCKNFLVTFLHANGLRPKEVKITIRDKDWAIDISPIRPRGEGYFFPESVQTLILELEATTEKKDELEEQVRIILRNKKSWRWQRIDKAYLELEDNASVAEYEWTRSKQLSGQLSDDDPDAETEDCENIAEHQWERLDSPGEYSSVGDSDHAADMKFPGEYSLDSEPGADPVYVVKVLKFTVRGPQPKWDGSTFAEAILQRGYDALNASFREYSRHDIKLP